jgi:hypothetical protein
MFKNKEKKAEGVVQVVAPNPNTTKRKEKIKDNRSPEV